MRARALSVAVTAALLVAAIWAGATLRIATDITRFLPPSGDARLDRTMSALARSGLNRLVVMTVDAGGDADLAGDAAARLAERLAGLPDVAWVRAGPDAGFQRAVYELYFPRRFGFVSNDPSRIPSMLSDEALGERARALRARLALPTSPFTREIASADPWLVFPRRFEGIRDSLGGGLEVRGGHFVTAGGHGVVLLESARSPFAGDASSRLLEGIEVAFDEVRAELGSTLSLESSAVHRFAVRAERRTRDDVRRVSAMGALGVIGFLFALFVRPRYLLAGHLPLVVGVATALVAARVVFGEVHGLTLAFGATLIGVALDYVVHALNHHVLEPAPDGPMGSLRRVWPGLVLGCATTVAGLLGLAWTSYPAVQEMAVLTSVGVAAALLATRWVMVPWLPPAPNPTRLHLRFVRVAGAALAAFEARPRALWLLPVAALGLVALGASRVETIDDIRVLSPPDPDLLAEDERVRGRVARVDAGRVVVAFGDDAEQALVRNDAVAARLEEARSEGLVGRVRSLHTLLWSEALQRENAARVRSAADVVARTRAVYAEAGFVPDAFDPFAEALRAPYAPMDLPTLLDSPIGPLASPFVLSRGGEAGVVLATYVADVRDPDALGARLDGIDGVVWFDQAAFLSEGYQRFRSRVTELVGAGLLFVFLLVLARYRALRPALAAFLPAVLAAAVALALVALLGFPLTLFHVVSVLLVLSMGVDYGVFTVEARRGGDRASIRATLVSLIVACLSTVLSFGSLALSEQPALRAMGLTTAFGVLASLALAPLAWAIWGGGRRGG